MPMAQPSSEALPPTVLWCRDGAGVVYSFVNWPFWDAPPFKNVVYAYVNSNNEVGYFGRADDLRERQQRHEKRGIAWQMGFNRLYVHQPMRLDRVDYISAEKRLIEFACPVLNTQHNWVKSAFGL